MSPTSFGVGSNRAFGVGKSSGSPNQTSTILYGYIKNVGGSNVIYNEVTGAQFSGTDLVGINSSNITTTFKKYNVGSIDFPYNGTLIYFTLPSIASSSFVTVEFWKYLDTTPSSFDFIVELNSYSGNYFMVEKNGTVRGPSYASGSAGGNWTDTINTWRHYVIGVNYSSGTIYRALDGVRVSPITFNAISSNPPTTIRFKDSLYNGSANGYMDELRVTTSDVYNLTNNSTYTVPVSNMGLYYPPV
jgi:hypothetical protein